MLQINMQETFFSDEGKLRKARLSLRGSLMISSLVKIELMQLVPHHHINSDNAQSEHFYTFMAYNNTPDDTTVAVRHRRKQTKRCKQKHTTSQLLPSVEKWKIAK